MPNTTSAELVAAVFKSKATATQARAALEKADRDMPGVQLNRIAIIEKGKDGKAPAKDAKAPAKDAKAPAAEKKEKK